MNAQAARLVGLYHEGRQVGFTRTAVVPVMEVAYLYDVYVLAEHRGRGLGKELVRETVDRGPYAGYRWLLDTTDAHGAVREVRVSAAERAFAGATAKVGSAA